jgi:hypothetical protein
MEINSKELERLKCLMLRCIISTQLQILKDIRINVFNPGLYKSEIEIWNDLIPNVIKDEDYRKYINLLTAKGTTGTTKITTMFNITTKKMYKIALSKLSIVNKEETFDPETFYNVDYDKLLKFEYACHYVIELFRNSYEEQRKILQGIWSIYDEKYNKKMNTPIMIKKIKKAIEKINEHENKS